MCRPLWHGIALMFAPLGLRALQPAGAQCGKSSALSLSLEMGVVFSVKRHGARTYGLCAAPAAAC